MGSSGINARVHGESNSLSINPLDMKCFALISLVGVALGAPAPEDAAAPVVLPYGYGLGAYPYALPYAGLPLAYNALHTGLVYPVAESYVHDAACDDAPVHAWDEAWAFYTGSLEGKFGNAAGIFPYRLAENMCSIMDTCLAGKSQVNRELEDAFIDGKNKIDQGDCSGAEAYKKTIMTKMSIPLIQATLNSAYNVANGDSSSKAKAEAATYAGSILPQVAKCSSADAEIIKNNLWIDSSPLDMDGFNAVKGAFENNYGCIGVTCDDIGGMGSGSGFEKCV